MAYLWGYYVCLMYEIDRASGKKSEKPGFYTLEASKNDLFSLTKDYIMFRGHVEEHLSYLQECKDIRGLEQMGKFDRFTAHGACLLGSQQNYYNVIRDHGRQPESGSIEQTVAFFTNFMSG